MKRYIRASVTNTSLQEMIQFAKGFKGYTIDLDKHIITIPFSPYTEVEDLQGRPYGFIPFAEDNGFTVTFETRDVPYMTKQPWSRSLFDDVRNKSHVAYLRNRLVATVTWE